MRKRKQIVSILWALLLFGFTVYAALDTFVIRHAYTVVEAESPAEQTAEATAESTPPATVIQASIAEATPEATAAPTEAAQVISTANSYSDGNVIISISEVRAYDSTVYVADVVLASPEYLQTAFANSTYGRNVTAKTSSIAENANAVLAINGDYYGARQSGYFGIINESEISAQALLDNGAWNVLSFGPALLIDGEIAVSSGEEVGRAMASNPRTAIGIVDDLHYLFVVSDGRTNASEGLSLRELAQVLEELGAKTAYNLDGGGSSTMVFQGQVVNNPTSNGKRITERSVSDIVCITC